MQIVIHAGAHFTDEGKLLGSLTQNLAVLADHGVALPPPSSYRRQIRDSLGQMSQSALATDYKGALLGAMIGESKPDRLILSNDNFFSVPRRAIRDNQFFPSAGDRMRAFSTMFYGEEIEIFLAIRNPATFLPALVNANPSLPIEETTGYSDPMALRWSQLILSLREAVPQMPITVWCNEDTPMLWEELLREMAGLDHSVQLQGSHDLLREIMSAEGMQRLEAFLAGHPSVTEFQKRRVIAAFLDKFALEDAIEEELDIPGWTDTLVEKLTETYDDDVYQIERIPGVTLITP